MVIFNYPEVERLLDHSAVAVFQGIFHLRIFTAVWALSLGGTLIGLILSQFRGLSVEDVASEILVLALIHLSFYLFPLLISFTFFFIILHSLKVLRQEFIYLKKLREGFKLSNFLVSLVPYTLLSLAGIALLILAKMKAWIDIPDLLLAFIIISVITLPHSFVMEWFYVKAKLRRS